MADLGDFYPSAGVQASPAGNGKPASPATASGRGIGGGAAGAPVHHSPALVVLAIVALSLLLLHHA